MACAFLCLPPTKCISFNLTHVMSRDTVETLVRRILWRFPAQPLSWRRTFAHKRSGQQWLCQAEPQLPPGWGFLPSPGPVPVLPLREDLPDPWTKSSKPGLVAVVPVFLRDPLLGSLHLIFTALSSTCLHSPPVRANPLSPSLLPAKDPQSNRVNNT